MSRHGVSMAAVFIIGCASHSVESTDSSRSSLSYIGQPVAVTTAVEPSTIAGAQETSAVTYFATNPFGQIAPTFLVAYNTNDGLGWANSYDNGASWIQHSSTNAGAIAPIIPVSEALAATFPIHGWTSRVFRTPSFSQA